MPEQLPQVDIPRRERAGWRDWATLLLAVGFALGIWHVDRGATSAHTAAATATAASVGNREIGYRNRAAICDFVREFGGIEPRQCHDPDIAAYRDPHIAPGEGERRNTTFLLCKILHSLQTPAPECGPVARATSH